MNNRLLFGCVLSASFLMMPFLSSFAEDTTYKGVVQVIGYENLYGKTPRMIGWGSASVIDNQGHLLTNNHVVDNGFGGTLDGFAVCVTVAQGTRPVCTFTASLIARDVERDIALLRVDMTDIFEKPTQLSQFPALSLAYEYVPTSQDDVVAIGYPWIGADTITQTVGVVAGTQDFNGVTYIKTDALIAGGNSGGPLTKDGRVIGVNTFGIGGYADGSLGYALSIKDAADFITEHTGKESSGGFDLTSFHTYLRTIHMTNEQGKLQDDVFTLDLVGGYRITEYEPNKLVVSYQTLPDQTSVQAFLIERFQTPELTTYEEFSYYLQKIGVYYGGYEKMKPVTIGGIQMYDVFEKSDPSEGLSQGYKKYVAQLTPTDALFFAVQTPTYDESLFQKAKQKLDAFLANVSFSQPASASVSIPDVVLQEPQITFEAFPSAEQPFTRGGWGGSLWSLRYSQGVLRNMLGSLHESILMNVYPQTRDLGRGVSIEELMRAKTQDITTTDKALFSVLGHPGFYFCESDSVYLRTKQGKDLLGDSCHAFIVVDYANGSLPYIIELQLQSEKKNIQQHKQIFLDYLRTGIDMAPVDNGQTTFSTLLQITPLFKDLITQHPDFSTVITYFVKHKILMANRENFEGDMPLTRGDVVKVYLKGVMGINMDVAAETCGYPVQYDCLFATQQVDVEGKKIPISQIITDLGIDTSAYASSSTLWRFDMIMKLYLAGIKEVPFTERHISSFEEIGEFLYPAQQQKLQDWEYSTFGKRRIALDEVIPTAQRRSPYHLTWHPTFGLLQNDYGSLQPYSFTATPQVTTPERSVMLKLCGQDLHCYLREEQKVYPVVTLGELVNTILPMIDRSIFMPELKEKKESDLYGGYEG